MSQNKPPRMGESVTVNGKPLAQYLGKVEKLKAIPRPKVKKYKQTKKRNRSRSKTRFISAAGRSSWTWMRENALRGTGIDTPAKRTRRRRPRK